MGARNMTQDTAKTQRYVSNVGTWCMPRLTPSAKPKNATTHMYVAVGILHYYAVCLGLYLFYPSEAGLSRF